MRTMYIDVPEGELKNLELGDVVNVKVTGKVKGLHAKPERPKGLKSSDPEGSDDYYKYASLDIRVQEVSIIEDSNEFAKLDESMD